MINANEVLEGKPEDKNQFVKMTCRQLSCVSLSSSDNLIPSRAGVRRQTGRGVKTSNAALNVYSAFQKHCLVTARLCNFFDAIEFLTKGNSNKTQNINLNSSKSIAIDNLFLLPKQRMF
jgi:hypothetical protein